MIKNAEEVVRAVQSIRSEYNKVIAMHPELSGFGAVVVLDMIDAALEIGDEDD